MSVVDPIRESPARDWRFDVCICGCIVVRSRAVICGDRRTIGVVGNVLVAIEIETSCRV